MRDIKELLSEVIKHAIGDLNLEEAHLACLKEGLYLDLPSDNRFGDLSTNIGLRLSKSLKKSPQEVSRSILTYLTGHIKDTPLKDYVKEIKVEGAGFINFYLNDTYYREQLKEMLVRGKDYLRVDIGKGAAVLIEFVSANPTGPLSVAHARQAAVGDALANILQFLGFKVTKEYYLNDEGNQITILGRSIELRLKELLGETIQFPDNHYQGDYIYDIAREIKDKNSQVKDFSAYGVEYILRIIKKELDDFGVKFDSWYSQKALTESGSITKAFDLLRKKVFLYDQDGAVWFKSTQFGDDKDRVVIKSDGSYTYLAPDIAYHQDKYKRGFLWLINLWGPDHHGYINRLKAAVEALGKSPHSLSIIIVQLASIFRDGKPLLMSTRKGQYITLREVLDEVGRDAARFFFMMRRTSSHLDFDVDVAKKTTSENPVYYIQYAHARIASILRNYPQKLEFADCEATFLKEKEEIALIKKLWQFSFVLAICFHTQDPYMVTVYLQELAESFHKFYDLHRVLGQDEKLTQARLALIDATRSFIAVGLDLLGISKPQEM